MKLALQFSKKEIQQIEKAIFEAELLTSGEIKVHIENHCTINELDRAKAIFEILEMDKTVLKNGILFYLATEDRKFAIIGDSGIHEKCQDTFWDSVKEVVIHSFKENKFTSGLINGIQLAGSLLSEHFPASSNDCNEISNKISFYKN
jgi:uncharacterized membrane protein